MDSSELSVGTGMTVSAPFTIEEWAFPTSSGSAVGLFGSRFRPSDVSFDAKLDRSRFRGDIGNGTRWLNASTDASFSETLNTWHHVARICSVDASNYAICADGKQIGSGSLGDIAVLSDNSHRLNLRSTGCCGDILPGNLDEARASNIVRSADWIEQNRAAHSHAVELEDRQREQPMCQQQLPESEQRLPVRRQRGHLPGAPDLHHYRWELSLVGTDEK